MFSIGSASRKKCVRILMILSALNAAVVLAAASRALADDDDGKTKVEVNISGVGNSAPKAPAGGEVSVKVEGKSSEYYNPTYFSFEAGAGMTGLRPTGKLDYTYGNRTLRQTMINGEATPNNLRLNVVGGRLVLTPVTGGRTTFYAGIYGAQYNHDIGGSGAMRALPLSISHEQQLTDAVKIKAAIEHAFLVQIDEGNLQSGGTSPVRGKGYAHDLKGTLGLDVKLSPKATLSFEGVVEDVKYKVLQAEGTPDQHFELKGQTSVTGKAGLTVAF